MIYQLKQIDTYGSRSSELKNFVYNMSCMGAVDNRGIRKPEMCVK